MQSLNWFCGESGPKFQKCSILRAFLVGLGCELRPSFEPWFTLKRLGVEIEAVIYDRALHHMYCRVVDVMDLMSCEGAFKYKEKHGSALCVK